MLFGDFVKRAFFIFFLLKGITRRRGRWINPPPPAGGATAERVPKSRVFATIKEHNKIIVNKL
jgi:hypothetical protein